MGLIQPITGKRPKHKRFDYTPRYYNPEKEKSKHRSIEFERKTRRGQGRSVLIYAALLSLLLYLLVTY